MVKAVFDELAPTGRSAHFTVGIYDDVTDLSLAVDQEFRYPGPTARCRPMFFGLGADGTVGANKASVKIIGEAPTCSPRATSSTTRRSRAR